MTIALVVLASGVPVALYIDVNTVVGVAPFVDSVELGNVLNTGTNVALVLFVFALLTVCKLVV